MKKKGYTLVEVLAVITILALLSAITVPIVTTSIKNSKESLYKDQEQIILRSAVNWAEANVSDLPESDKSIAVTLGLLKANGYLSKNLKNPKTGYLFPDDMVVNISKKSDDNEPPEDNVKYNGNYKFTFDEKSGTDNQITIDIPAIQIDVCSDNNIECINENIDLIYDNISNSVSIAYRDKSNQELSANDLKNYSYNGNTIQTIDMSKYGFYYAYYSPTSLQEEIKDKVKILIINDTEAPEIIFTDETFNYTLGDTIDLNKATCEDNSGSCKIAIIGNVNPSKEGNYIITYIASDPSGNTSKIKKVIRISE